MVTAKEALALSKVAIAKKEEEARPIAENTLAQLMSKIAHAANKADYSIIYDPISYHVDSLVVASLQGLGYKVQYIHSTYLISWKHE